MTAKQLVSITRLFTDGGTPSEQAQRLIDSGLLADLRDANVGAINRKDFRKVCGLKPICAQEGNILTLDRERPFNPAEFLGAGWSIWRGPADGNGLEGEEDQDERSLELTSLDLSQLRLETCLMKGETSIAGEAKQKCLKAMKAIPLDAVIFRTFWENQDLIPEAWKNKTNGNATYVYFNATVLRSPSGGRCVLYLYWDDSGWHWHCGWLGHGWGVLCPSVVLASESLVA